jgi:hypothetical protein
MLPLLWLLACADPCSGGAVHGRVTWFSAQSWGTATLTYEDVGLEANYDASLKPRTVSLSDDGAFAFDDLEGGTVDLGVSVGSTGELGTVECAGYLEGIDVCGDIVHADVTDDEIGGCTSSD